MNSYHRSYEMQSVECDLMMRGYPRDVILYARSSYRCNNVYFIRFSVLILLNFVYAENTETFKAMFPCFCCGVF